MNNSKAPLVKSSRSNEFWKCSNTILSGPHGCNMWNFRHHCQHNLHHHHFLQFSLLLTFEKSCTRHSPTRFAWVLSSISIDDSASLLSIASYPLIKKHFHSTTFYSTQNDINLLFYTNENYLMFMKYISP